MKCWSDVDMTKRTAIMHDNLPLLTVTEAAVLEQLFVDAMLADALVVRLSPTVAVIDPVKVEAVVARLKKLGHLPKVV